MKRCIINMINLTTIIYPNYISLFIFFISLRDRKFLNWRKLILQPGKPAFRQDGPMWNEIRGQVLFAACSRQHTIKYKPNTEFMRTFKLKATCNSKITRGKSCHKDRLTTWETLKLSQTTCYSLTYILKKYCM